MVDESLSFLSEAIHRVHVTEGFSEVLNEKQLDDVYCAALNLSTAVTEYLILAIQYFTDNSPCEPSESSD
jgi:hypothetical protein